MWLCQCGRVASGSLNAETGREPRATGGADGRAGHIRCSTRYGGGSVFTIPEGADTRRTVHSVEE
jgi:hypothetical protein